MGYAELWNLINVWPLAKFFSRKWSESDFHNGLHREKVSQQCVFPDTCKGPFIVGEINTYWWEVESHQCIAMCDHWPSSFLESESESNIHNGLHGKRGSQRCVAKPFSMGAQERGRHCSQIISQYTISANLLIFIKRAMRKNTVGCLCKICVS